MGATIETFTPSEDPLVFTDTAALKVKGLLEEEQNPNLMLRVFVSGGGVLAFSMDSLLMKIWVMAIPWWKSRV